MNWCSVLIGIQQYCSFRMFCIWDTMLTIDCFCVCVNAKRNKKPFVCVWQINKKIISNRTRFHPNNQEWFFLGEIPKKNYNLKSINCQKKSEGNHSSSSEEAIQFQLMTSQQQKHSHTHTHTHIESLSIVIILTSSSSSLPSAMMMIWKFSFFSHHQIIFFLNDSK